MRVFAIDPGRTSGFAVFVTEKGVWAAHEVGLGGCGWQHLRRFRRGEVGQAEALYVLIERFGPDAVVIEDFILDTRRASGKRSLLSPVRITAMLEYELSGRMPITKQSASDAKSVITDRRLKRWGYWTPASTHARDATRHGLLFLRRSKTSMDVVGQKKE